jgi:hypothetical protein
MPALRSALPKSADKRWWSSTNAIRFTLVLSKPGMNETAHFKPRRVGNSKNSDISADPLPATYRKPHDRKSERPDWRVEKNVGKRAVRLDLLG